MENQAAVENITKLAGAVEAGGEGGDEERDANKDLSGDWSGRETAARCSMLATRK
jgi:hypothetical protein